MKGVHDIKWLKCHLTGFVVVMGAVMFPVISSIYMKSSSSGSLFIPNLLLAHGMAAA